MRVFIEKPNASERETNVELAQLIHPHAEGTFSLDVAYPIRDARYVLAWQPRAVPEADARASRFVEYAKANGQDLLKRFAAILNDYSVFCPMSLALYVPFSKTRLDQVAKIVPDDLAPFLTPPPQIELTGPSR